MSPATATETDVAARVYKGEWALLLLLLLLVVASAVGVVLSVHQTRLGYADIQSLEADRDALEGEYERLLLEQGAFADYARVDQVAREKLGMYTPVTREVVIVKEAR
ncbi:MAG: cell division protein FtsL [Gammaproteobacteria bacterium]|nr:cell division protein FtsL [Gammaproteobacteria bacterium]